MPTIESLELKVSSNAQSATASIDKLKSSLTKLGDACSKAVSGMSGTADKINQLGNATRNLAGAEKLTALAEGLRGLSKVGKMKIDASVANTIVTISDATAKIDSGSVYMLGSLADGLRKLSGLGSVRISADLPNSIVSLVNAANQVKFTTAGNLGTLSRAVESLRGVGSINLNKDLPKTIMDLSDAFALFDMAGLEKIEGLVTSLNQLGGVEKAQGFGQIVKKLGELPEVMEKLNASDLEGFTENIRRLTEALAPLATNLQGVNSGFKEMPHQIEMVSQQTEKASHSFDRFGSGLKRLVTHFIGIHTVTELLSTSISESMQYIENYNLFTVAMGEYAEQAEAYADRVANALGIDPSAWMREQGVFMTLVSGFGVASDKAYVMSQNLTQLGYDIASFFNLDVATAMQKVESGIAGELEPLRRLGYDLSEARLKAIALELGITKSYKAMSQAEKSQLRYYAMLNQVTTAQTDMARTINAPANQMRVLRAQIQQLCRALGDLFVPILSQVLPYIIAFTKAIKNLIKAINALFSGSKDGAAGIESISRSMGALDIATVSAVGSSSDLAQNLLGFDEVNAMLDDATSGTKAYAAETAAATDEMKKLAKAVMGYDELNVIQDAAEAGGGGGGGGGDKDPGDDFDIEPPSYDFLGDAINNEVDKIYGKLEPIITWITDHMELIKGTITTIGTLIAGWKISKFIDGLGEAKTLLGKIGSLLAGVVTAALTVTFSYKFTKDYLSSGDPVKLILSALTSLIGSVITGKLVARALGAGAGYIAGGITLALTAVADIIAKSASIKENGFDGKQIITDILAALKGALAGAAIAKALGLNTAALFTSGLIGMGITFALSGFVGLVSMEFSTNSDKVGSLVNGAITVLGTTITGLAVGKALGLSAAGIATEGVIGGVFGIALVATVLLAKVVCEEFNVKAAPGWGDTVLSAEKVQKLVQGLFDVDIEAHIQYAGTVASDLDQAVKDINSTIKDINGELDKLEIGGEIDPDAWSAVYESLFAPETGLIPKLQTQLLDENNKLKASFELVPPEDSEGNILTDILPDADSLDAELTKIGKSMSNLITKGMEEGLIPKEEELLGVYRDFFLRLDARLKEEDINFEFGMKMDELLGSLSSDTMAEVVSTFKGYKEDLISEYTDIALAQKQALIREKAMREETLALYEELGDEEGAARMRTELENINAELKKWDLDTTISDAVEKITGPGEESLTKSIVAIFKNGFDNDTVRDSIIGQTNSFVLRWNNGLSDALERGDIDGVADEWGQMLNNALQKTLGNDDYQVFLEAKNTFGITDWDAFDKATQDELLQQLIDTVGAENAIRIMQNLGYDISENISSGMTNAQALAELAQGGKDAVKAVNNGIEKTDVSDISVDVELDKGETWSGSTVEGFVNKYLGGAVTKGIELIKGNSWKNTTVSGWITNIKDNFGAAVSKPIGLVKNAWSTVASWVNNDSNKGGEVKKPISLGKSGWTTLTGFLTNKDNNGGDLTKPVGLKKGFSGNTVTGWFSFSNLLGGNVEKGVQLKANFGDSSTWWGKAFTVITWMSKTGLLGGDVEKSVVLTRAASWAQGINQWIVGKNGKWSHDFTVNLKKGTGQLTWLPSVYGAKLTLAANGAYGLDTGQLFVAREAGPEMVGSIGSRTAVANNDQIVEAVSLGVYQAVSAAMSNNNSNGETANITINLDGRVIYQNQQKISRERGVNLGMGAFAYGG